MIHVIEIREMVPGGKPGTVKFKSTANLTYNCNKEEFNGHWAVGEKYKIDFNTSSFQGRNGPVEMKWVNQARFWKDGDGPVEPPEKPVYQGGGGGSYGGNSGGGMNTKKSDYDPEVGKRQTAANVAAAIIGQRTQGMGIVMDDLDELSTIFKTIADVVYGWVNEKQAKSDDGVADGGSNEGAGSKGDDEFADTF